MSDYIDNVIVGVIASLVFWCFQPLLEKLTLKVPKLLIVIRIVFVFILVGYLFSGINNNEHLGGQAPTETVNFKKGGWGPDRPVFHKTLLPLSLLSILYTTDKIGEMNVILFIFQIDPLHLEIMQWLLLERHTK